MSKEDHIAFIKLAYELVTLPSLEPYLVNKFASTLLELIRLVLNEVYQKMFWMSVLSTCMLLRNVNQSICRCLGCLFCFLIDSRYDDRVVQ